MEASLSIRHERSARAVEALRKRVAGYAGHIANKHAWLNLAHEPTRRPTHELPPPLDARPFFVQALETPPTDTEKIDKAIQIRRPVRDSRRNFVSVLEARETDPDMVYRLEEVYSEGATNLARYGGGGYAVAAETEQGMLLLFVNGSRNKTNVDVPTDVDEHGRGNDIVNAFANQSGLCYGQVGVNTNAEGATTEAHFSLQAAPGKNATEVRWYSFDNAGAPEMQWDV